LLKYTEKEGHQQNPQAGEIPEILSVLSQNAQEEPICPQVGEKKKVK
jgi:hypothetical protein